MVLFKHQGSEQAPQQVKDFMEFLGKAKQDAFKFFGY